MINVTVLLAGTKTDFKMSRESSIMELHSKVLDHGRENKLLQQDNQVLLYSSESILDFHENVFSMDNSFSDFCECLSSFNCSDYLHCNFCADESVSVITKIENSLHS